MKQVFLRDGHHYDAHFKDLVEDIPFFCQQVKEYGDPLLELCCGTGRVSIPLAKEGFSVTGLDVSPMMLKRGREKAKGEKVHVNWYQMDCRHFSLKERFKCILFPFNSISLLLHFQELELCLQCVKEHLAPSGVFVVSLFNPSFTILSRDKDIYYHQATYEDPYGGGTVEVMERTDYDQVTQISKTRLLYRLKGEEWEEELAMRIYFPQELKAILHYNGFLVQKTYGDFQGNPLQHNSSHQILIASLR